MAYARLEDARDEVSSNPYLDRLRSLPRIGELRYEHTALSLFSGGGGLDLGLAFAGFDVNFASDIEQPHCDTISHNFPHCLTLASDIKDLTGDLVRKKTGQESFELIAGGPPCQAFSILGNRGSFDDPRGQLVYQYVRLVQEIRPKAFVFENVPGLLTVRGGNDWKSLLAYFEHETRYRIFHKVLNAADYGIPQMRRRVFVVGFVDRDVDFQFPEPTHQSENGQLTLLSNVFKPWLPARFALEDVEGLPNHRIRPHGDRVRLRYSQIPVGGRDRVDHTDRVHPDRPSGTVIVGSRAGGGRPHIHPSIPRHLSVREAARLQSFPDWYEFQSTETWQYRAVGNAVPPLLALAVGKHISKALSKQG
jgi:DNA (cytosine-5)-methyltransferase 1